MCGIVGIHNLTTDYPIAESTLRQMLATIRHRGPDQFGIYCGDRVGLGNARLSIIDLNTGQQPIGNEDGTLWIVFNGEIFNYVELRPELESRGHQFTTTSDTEVILHLYEDYGPACLEHLNGQFSIAIWDVRNQSLFLARDRVGIRPLYYTIVDGALIFASEIKALLADPRVFAKLDPVALDQVFTFWSPLAPRTVFQGIQTLPPGHYLLAQDGDVRISSYWQFHFPDAAEFERNRCGPFTAFAPGTAEYNHYLETFCSLLIDSTQIRLRADVPVGAYLSGGLDSSLTSAIVRNHTNNHLDSFSIAFSDPAFDESDFQKKMAHELGTEHQVVHVEHADIGRVFSDVIWHTETPILRTSPAPMFLLSSLVQRQGYKVVLTGEGADEFLGGYNIFREAKVRRFWAVDPASALRPLLLTRLYDYIEDLGSGRGTFLAAFFKQGMEQLDDPTYSHAVRWRNTSRCRRFFSPEMKHAVAAQMGATPHTAHIPYPDDFQRWHPLNQAQYLEITIFMAEYLLSSQGDRMGMAHSVEGRFPFLDHRLIEFANYLPPSLKLRGLTEKYLLKQLGKRWLPDVIWARPKRPYRAPIHRAFFNNNTQGWVLDLLSEESVIRSGLFHPKAVSQLLRRAQSGQGLSETDDMALAGILSTLLAQQRFVTDYQMAPPLDEAEDVKVVVEPKI